MCRGGSRQPASMIVAALVAVTLTGCAADSPGPITAERTDSAGVEIVTNRGADFTLDWTFTPTLTLGGEDEGPESFFGIGPTNIAADHTGNLYIMDSGNHRIVIFDEAGNHLRTLGRQGSGPGEFQMWPQGITVAADGTINVYDYGKRGLVRFAPDGSPLPTRRLSDGQLVSYALLGDGIAIQDSHSDDEVAFYRIQAITDAGDTTTIVSLPQPSQRPVDFGCVRIGGMEKVFAPTPHWAAGTDRILVNPGAEYRIDLYAGARLTASIRRDLEPRRATRELAIHYIGEDMKIGLPTGECRVPAARVVEERGVADLIPAIGQIRIAPNGTTWVQRYAIRDEIAPIDIFSPDGEYLGTLPEGAPFPAAFLPDGQIAAIEKDEFDLQRVVIYELGIDNPTPHT